MIQVARSYEAAQQLVRVQDDLLGQSINTLGKV
jgi:flagellar basal body rod protein FlgG